MFVRVFCFTFIVYLVMLLMQPCQDMIAMFDDCGQKTGITHVETPSNADPQSDDCSPFCICSCCSLSVADRSVSNTVATNIETIPVSTTTISEYKSPDSATFQNSIWQPPKA